MVIITTKSTRLSWIVHGYKEHGRLAARHTSLSTLLLSILTSHFGVEAALSVQKQRRRKEEIVAQLANGLAPGEDIKTITKYNVLLPI